MDSKDRYQIRHAAGKYWLLDMEQTGDYKQPIVMNETGALILENYWRTGSYEKTAEALAAVYEIEPEEVSGDVEAFLEQLKQQGVEL